MPLRSSTRTIRRATQPTELTQAPKYRLHLALDGDNNPNTPPTTSDDLNTLLGTFRNDARLRRRSVRRDVYFH